MNFKHHFVRFEVIEEEDKSRRVGDIDDFQVMCEFHPPFLIYARRFTDRRHNVPSLFAEL